MKWQSVSGPGSRTALRARPAKKAAAAISVLLRMAARMLGGCWRSTANSHMNDHGESAVDDCRNRDDRRQQRKPERAAPSCIETYKRPVKLASAEVRVSRGTALPLGATLTPEGTNFAVFSKHASGVTLVLFTPDGDQSTVGVPLDPRLNRTGQVWHVLVYGLNAPVHYGFKMQGTPDAGSFHRSSDGYILLDPYARAVSVAIDGSPYGRQRRSVIVDDAFEWESDQPLNRPLAESVIYELHVRGFTRHPSGTVQYPGTFAGLVEKIPYLEELGVTAVELLPITDFDDKDCERTNPFSGEKLVNYWGYHPVSFFALKRSYSSDDTDRGHIREFKGMVKSVHAAGIEVILDVVFNHTAEGDERGPTLSFRGIDKSVYYMIDPNTGKYLNYSGCGNTLNCNHPLVRDLIRDCLRYWVTEMHVDGFRFDLASVLGRGQDGAVLANPPLLEGLAADPILANTKLIAEAWDAAGLYQVGSFPAWGRWAEWNGRFRDDVRRFIKGDPGMVPALATRLYGSPDLYQSSERQPYHSINFVTCHDGFTLADLVSYDVKHNEMNGENNADGMADNLSWNCGCEGPTHDPDIVRLRRRQMKNFATILMMAHGVPMILAGDECARTQQGNSNAYCQDNPVSWIDWNLKEENADLFRFFRLLIAFRRTHAAMRRISFAPMPCCAQVAWHGVKLGQPDWSWDSRSLAMQRWATDGSRGEDHIYFIANAHEESHVFELPALPHGRWYRFIDTMLDSTADIAESSDSAALVGAAYYEVGPRSVVVLASRP